MPVVISFISQKGGVGKSTLARALAAVAGHAGVKLLLADLDPQQNTVLRWQRIRVQNPKAPPIRVEGFKKVDAALDAGVESDLIIIDTPGNVTASTLEAVQKSHLVVQPTGPGLDDLDPAVLLFHELTNAGIPRSRLVLALCRTQNRKEEDEARAYLVGAGYAVLEASIPEKASYRTAQNNGLGLTETKERALNERADRLVAELLKTVRVEIARMQKLEKRKSGTEDVA